MDHPDLKIMHVEAYINRISCVHHRNFDSDEFNRDIAQGSKTTVSTSCYPFLATFFQFIIQHHPTICRTYIVKGP